MSLLSSRPDLSPSNIILAYDNMCNLDRLKVARIPLPLSRKGLQNIWLDISKIIDSFHLRNHKNQACQTKYSPHKMKEEHPEFNTQAGEQTFTWAGRFKNILCAMNKTHHLFYLHRMILRRNAYTSRCYQKGRKPILPKSKK